MVENGLNRWPKRYTPFPDVLQASGYATALFGKAGVMPVPNAFRAKESWVLEQRRLDPHERRSAGTTQYEFLETFLVNQTLAWIEAHEEQQQDQQQQHEEAKVQEGSKTKVPWFVWLSMLSPHGPNIVPTEWRNPWAQATASLPPSDPPQEGDWTLLPTQTKNLLGLDKQPPKDRAGSVGISPDALIDLKRRYYAQVSDFVL